MEKLEYACQTKGEKGNFTTVAYKVPKIVTEIY